MTDHTATGKGEAGAWKRDLTLIVNQEEAYQLACLKFNESNLARSYCELVEQRQALNSQLPARVEYYWRGTERCAEYRDSDGKPVPPDTIAAALNAPAPSTAPVAWRCKDFGDGWIIYQDEADVQRYQERTGCLMEPLYTASPPAPTDVQVAALRDIASDAKIGGVNVFGRLLYLSSISRANYDNPIRRTPIILDDHDWRWMRPLADLIDAALSTVPAPLTGRDERLEEVIAKAIIDAGCTSPDGTLVHDGTTKVVRAALSALTTSPATGVDAANAEAFEALREVEVAWLSSELSSSIANLGYPVGCGIAPHPETVKKAATALFDRYKRMIELARATGARDAGMNATTQLSAMRKALEEALNLLRSDVPATDHHRIANAIIEIDAALAQTNDEGRKG